MHALVKRVRYI